MTPKSKRFLITALVVLLGMVIVYAVFQGAGRRGQPTPQTPVPAENLTAERSTDESAPAADPMTPQEAGQEGPAIGVPEENVAGAGTDESSDGQSQPALRFRRQPVETFASLGDLDSADNTARLQLEFSPFGAGLSQVTLADYYHTRERRADDRYTLLDGVWDRRPVMGIRRVYIDGQRIEAYDESAPGQPHAFRQTAPGAFEGVIVDENDEPVLTILRRYELGDVEGEVTIHQQVRNETKRALRVQIEQWGPGDLPYSHDGYGDFRRVRFGYLDPRSAEVVLAGESDYLQRRADLLKTAIENNDQTIWPNRISDEKRFTLSWVAMTNRYFGFAVHRAVADPEANLARSLDQVQRVEVWLESRGEPSIGAISKDDIGNRYMTLKLIGSELSIAPGQTRQLDLGVYAGPLRSSLLANEEPYASFSFKQLVVYQLSCAFCTFQWLTHFLLWFLRLIEGDVIRIAGLGIGVHDWAVAIIILVICVRALLHPLTKKGQISMQRLSRNMAKLQPEIKKLQEKYKDNPKKLQQEQMALYREHNVNPAGCLGMLPMFLQTPIWIALYAMLYFAIELRQEPAFYGVFQLFGNWSFLADLSQPDHFIEFSTGFTLPFLGWGVTGINALPILMGVIFFLQQKYLTPPNPNMTPEQEQQQKIMRIVFPLVFPLFLYSAPSGLTLYIITSSAIGILESRYIRSHIDSLDLEKDAKSKASTPTKKVTNRAEKFRRER